MMRQRGGGTIVDVASSVSFVGMSDEPLGSRPEVL